MQFIRANVSIIIAVLLIMAVGIFIYFDVAGIEKPATHTATSTGEALFERVPVDAETGEEIPPPSLDRPYTPDPSLPEDIQASNRKKVEEVKSHLREQPGLPQQWLTLALYYKNSGDFEGAREAWEYVAVRWPEDVVAYANLGDLYTNYLPDYPKAEAYLRDAITVKPDYTPAYRALSELYRLKYKTTTSLAVDILVQGLEANPRSVDLLISLGYYYQETGSTTDARKYFEQALAEARKANDTLRASQIEAELNRL